MKPDPFPDLSRPFRMVVVGGGAAGFFAALNTVEKNPNAHVTILEASTRPLQKVRISGGGRCNLTHACFDPARLVEFYPRGQKELRSLFARFQPQDTMRWFEARGLSLKTEADGRVFPASDQSEEVIALFLALAKKASISLHTQTRVDAIQHRDGQFQLQVGNKLEVFDICLLSTGYSPAGWQLAKGLGHTITPPVPSLFPFTIVSPVIAGLQGISLAKARGKLTVKTDGKPFRVEADGALLITHTGLSGPLIYRLSAWGAQALAQKGYQGALTLDLLPDFPEESLQANLREKFQQAEAKKKIANTSFPGLPIRLWQSIVVTSGIDPEARGETVSQKALNRLSENLKRLSLPVTGKSPSKEEFVSCGGVLRAEVDFKTMRSRQVPGLFFGGEILDIDGLTGGFNFQACWSEGWAISEALKQS